MSGLITFALAVAGVVFALTWLMARRRVTRILAMLTAVGILGFFLNLLGEHFPRGG